MEFAVKYLDRKTEKGIFRYESDTAFSEANFKANLSALSYCGWFETAEIVKTPWTTPQAVDNTDLVNNDKDFKVILTFKYVPTGHFKRILIPAPKINVATGICMTMGESRMIVPGTKPVGGVGSDGNTLAPLIETALGYDSGDLVFMSGHSNKKP